MLLVFDIRLKIERSDDRVMIGNILLDTPEIVRGKLIIVKYEVDTKGG